MPKERALSVGGHSLRVWEQGDGGAVPAVFFAGIGGLPRWTPFLDELAASRRVIAPALPGFPGNEAFRHLDGLLDWIVQALETVEALEAAPVDLIGSSVGGALAAEVAALGGGLVNRLVLMAPFGLFDPEAPSADIWAQPPGPDAIPNLACENPDAWRAQWTAPEGDELEWQVMQSRAMEAAARLLFPFGATGVESRLRRIHRPTLLLRGERDRVIPAAYQERFRAALAGPVHADVILGAGHLAELDAPRETARAIHAFLTDRRFA